MSGRVRLISTDIPAIDVPKHIDGSRDTLWNVAKSIGGWVRSRIFGALVSWRALKYTFFVFFHVLPNRSTVDRAPLRTNLLRRPCQCYRLDSFSGNDQAVLNHRHRPAGGANLNIVEQRYVAGRILADENQVDAIRRRRESASKSLPCVGLFDESRRREIVAAADRTAPDRNGNLAKPVAFVAGKSIRPR